MKRIREYLKRLLKGGQYLEIWKQKQEKTMNHANSKSN